MTSNDPFAVVEEVSAQRRVNLNLTAIVTPLIIAAVLWAALMWWKR